MSTPLLQQIGFRLPAIIIYLVGLGLSAMFWHRAPRAALFVLLAMAVALVVSVGNAIAFNYVLQQHTASNRAQMLSALSVITSIASPVPYVLLLAAAFTGRSREDAGFPVNFPPPLPPDNPYLPGR